MPGSLSTLSDFSDGRRALIITGCLPDDSGGIVYRAYDETVNTEPTVGPILLPLDLLTNENLIHELGSGEVYERRIVTVTGIAAHLALQHFDTPNPTHTIFV
jgi:hypothetical protein